MKFSLGDINRSVFARSSLKPIQTLALIESGAWESMGLKSEHLAIACGSHNGESLHTDLVKQWLHSMDLSVENLACGPSWPIHQNTRDKQLIEGLEMSRVCHNCSGKHSGMLSMARHFEVSVENYDDYDHKTQQTWLGLLSEVVQTNVFECVWDKDGCGLPAPAIPMKAIAFGLAQFANPQRQSIRRQSAMESVFEAMNRHPELVAGEDRACTKIMKATNNDVIVKVGAEAYFVGAIASKGLGFALKIDDGNVRAANVAVGALLKRIGSIETEAYQDLKDILCPDIINSQNYVTGQNRPSDVWD